MFTNLTSIDDANCSPTIAEREVLDLPIPTHVQNNLRLVQLVWYICKTNIQRFNFSPIQEEISFNDGDWSPMVDCNFNTDDDNNSEVSDLDYYLPGKIHYLEMKLVLTSLKLICIQSEHSKVPELELRNCKLFRAI